MQFLRSRTQQNRPKSSPSKNLTISLSSSKKFCGHQGLHQTNQEGFNFALTKPQRNLSGRSRAMTKNVSDHRIFSLRPKFCFDPPAENNIACAESYSNYSVSTSHIIIPPPKINQKTRFPEIKPFHHRKINPKVAKVYNP